MLEDSLQLAALPRPEAIRAIMWEDSLQLAAWTAARLSDAARRPAGANSGSAAAAAAPPALAWGGGNAGQRRCFEAAKAVETQAKGGVFSHEGSGAAIAKTVSWPRRATKRRAKALF